MKKFIALLLVFIIAFSVCAPAFADSAAEEAEQASETAEAAQEGTQSESAAGNDIWPLIYVVAGGLALFLGYARGRKKESKEREVYKNIK